MIETRRRTQSPLLSIQLLLSVAALAAFPVADARAAGNAAPAAQQGRVIVLGFDGADAATAARLMDAGELPNLAALRSAGTFAPLGTTNPAESPVSWAALNCGQNPAKTGVPGFIRRELPKRTGKLEDVLPSPGFGHLRGPERVAVEGLEGTPIPTWSPNALGGALGAGTFALFLGVFLLLRMRAALAIVLALILGSAGFVGGRALRGYLPSAVPAWKNPMESTPFWETAAAAGVPCVVLDAAQSFDRKPVGDARVLAGLGVPDARGNVNGFFLYTSAEDQFYRAPEGKFTESNGQIFRVDLRGGAYESLLPGPANFWNIDKIQVEIDAVDAAYAEPSLGYKESTALDKRRGELVAALREESKKSVCLPFRAVPQGDKVALTLDHETQVLDRGQWSDWYRLTFELNPLLKVKALTRAKLLKSGADGLEVYVDALQYDPANPPFWQPLSQPASFATELAHACGPFETVGWACMNLPLKDSVIDPISFLQDIEFTMNWRAQMTYKSLAKNDWRLLMSCESTPDRVQHMMYQHYDAEHPMYDAKEAARSLTFDGESITLAQAIPASYRSMDRIVGEVVKKHMKPDDTLIVCSDHGFQSFRYQVHINNWLIEKGYAAVRAGVDPSAAGRGLGWVDWSKTRAYAVGLGMVYVNQKGREGQGIVPHDEARAVLDSIRRDFVDHVDPATGQKIGVDAYVMSDIHSGKHLDREADMLLCFSAGYRVSWLTSGGGISCGADDDGVLAMSSTIVPNNKNWSGDHVTVDPSLVAGIFFSNRKFQMPTDGVDLLHIAPTVLTLLGAPIPPEYDKPALTLAQ